ncbi:MAG: restriction endonuclease subunit S [Burkholderiales bacterium]|nr:restriction endonuclease subunit S [Burkholderiales bacterium]
MIAGKHIESGVIDWNACDHISEFRYRESSEIALAEGDVIITKDGTIGRVARIDCLPGKATINGTMMLIRPERGIHYGYLYHVLNGAEFKKLIEDKVSGSSIPHIFQRDMVALPISFPPIEHQAKLAQVLDTLDTAIHETEAIIAKLKAVKQGLLQNLLTRGIDANGELRPPQSEAPQLYKESPLGWIPKEWDFSSLTSLGTDGLNNGVFKEPRRVGSGIALVNVADLYRGDSVSLDDCERFAATDAERSRYSARQGDIFFTRSSLKLEGIAQTSFLAVETDSAVFECHVMRLRPNRVKVVPRFLKEWCVGIHARKHFMAQAKQVTMTTISQDGIASLDCPRPPLKEQLEAVRRMESVDSRLNAEVLTAKKLSAEKRALMDDLLTGRVRVTPLLAQAARSGETASA